MHGAGLTNLAFMPAGGVVVELIDAFAPVSLAGCGGFSPLAAVFGMHHAVFRYSRPSEAEAGRAAAATRQLFDRSATSRLPGSLRRSRLAGAEEGEETVCG
jgi:hypothetical protein